MARYEPSDLTGVLAPINAELEKIKLAINDTLSRKADTPNAMEGSLDLNSNRILNLPAPVSPTEPLRAGDIDIGALNVSVAELELLVQDLDDQVQDFNVTYLGTFASAPATAPDGSALAIGMLYFNSTSLAMQVYTGVAWETAYVPTSESFTDISVDSLQFTGGTGTQGTMSWDDAGETVQLIQNGSVLQLGQELHYHVVNNTISEIAKGTPVMATGTVGASGKITIAPMNGTVLANAKLFLGFTTTAIAPSAEGKVTHFGKVRGLNTSAYAEGDILYISTSTIGAVTTTEPVAGMKLPVAFVVTVHPSVGTLVVRATNGVRMADLHDVNETALAINDLLKYNGTEWVPTKQFRETVYALAGTAINPVNGTIQTKTLAANTTFTESLASGDSVTLMLTKGAFTVTWPTISWIGGAPTLEAGLNVIVLFKVGSTLYGAYSGAV